MEMKADIAGKPTDTQFHKIYIQKHENVRYMVDTLSTRFRFTRMPDVVDTLFYRSTFRNITVECQRNWITIFQKIYFRNKRMSGTRSSATSRNTRMSGAVMDTIFY